LATTQQPDAVRIVCSDSLSEEARHVLFEWSSDPFCSKEWGLTWRPKTDHVQIFLGDHLAAHVGLVRAIVHADGKAFPVGGIGDVVTVPEFRNRRLAQRGLEKAIEIIHEDWKCDYAMLFCFPPKRAFYERQGWTVINTPVWIDQPDGKIIAPMIPMFLSRSGGNWDFDQAAVEGLPW
jgi:GNAT superfamily N-acetyltransferase